MSSTTSVLFIGAGNMGSALMNAVSQVEQVSVSFFEINETLKNKLAQNSKFIPVTSLEDGLINASIVVLAVKPQVFESVAAEIKSLVKKSLTFVSVMAGVSLDTLQSSLSSSLKDEQHTFIRTMPNLPATIGAGTIALATDGVDEKKLSLVEKLFEKAGDIIRVQESWMDAVTGVSGSGPAYVFQFAEGLIQGGVKAGLPRDTAKKLAISTIIGSTELMRQSGEEPGTLTGKVTSPGGTTIFGLHALEEASFRNGLMNAVESAAKRSGQLGKK